MQLISQDNCYFFIYLLKLLGDLLNNYCWNDDLMNVSRLLFSITILLTYPIECFVCREVLQHTFWGKMEEQEDAEESRKRHIALTLILVLSSYVASLITDCLGIVLEINVSFIRIRIYNKIFVSIQFLNRSMKILICF